MRLDLRQLKRQIVLLLSLSLGGGAAWAQVPAQLPGKWEMRQISFTATQAVPPAVQARMDSPEVAELNQELADGTAHLWVEFRPDGTYQFTVTRPGQPVRLETGTYAVRAGTIFAQSPEGESSFNNQQIIQLSRRRFVVDFLVGDELPDVREEMEYRRMP